MRRIAKLWNARMLMGLTLLMIQDSSTTALIDSEFLQERKNYTNAQAVCKELRGSLAHIASEERTEGLGKLVQQIPTFVGLSNRDEETNWKNEFDEPLSCFDYRAWAMTEPTISRGCVGLVRPQNSRSSSSWTVLPCSRKSPYICEIHPRSRSNTHHRPDTK